MILDTNALSAIADGESGAVKWFSSAARVAIPVIVLGATVLDVDEETARWYAELRIQLKEAGTPIPSNDAWIAALGRQHTMPILSRDRHFDLIKGLKRLDW